MEVEIREMEIRDYEEVMALWQDSEGVGLSDADSRGGIARYLDRNPGHSFVARTGDQLVGAVLGGHDGRRGYIHHLAVGKTHRRQGVGKTLVQRCLSRLRADGILKCHIFVFSGQSDAVDFWAKIGWFERTELIMMSHQ